MNKRDIICITAYVNNEERKNLLKECITACRKFGMDILVASHSVLTEDIIKMVDYYVYDADNRFNNGGHIILWKQFPNMKMADIETLAAITTEEEIKEYAQALGWDKKQINAIKL